MRECSDTGPEGTGDKICGQRRKRREQQPALTMASRAARPIIIAFIRWVCIVRCSGGGNGRMAQLVNFSVYRQVQVGKLLHVDGN